MAPDSDSKNSVPILVEAQTSRKVPKKIYIPIRIQTNALKNDDIAINATYISVEDLPRRKRKDIEIRYLESIRSVGEKIRASYQSCNQEKCPFIKERLNQHHMEHHQMEQNQRVQRETEQRHMRHRQMEHRCMEQCQKERNQMDQQDCYMHQDNQMDQQSYMEQHQDDQEYCRLERDHVNGEMQNPVYHCDRNRQSQLKPMDTKQASKESVHLVVSSGPRGNVSVAISPSASILKKPPNSRQKENRHAKCVDFNHTAQSSFDTNPFRNDRRTQCNQPAPTRCNNKPKPVKTKFNRDELQEEVHKWFENVPIYPNLSCSLREMRRNMINEFINKVYALTSDPNTIDYEENVRIEVDNFLNALPMWHPGAKRDQLHLKDEIKNDLLEKISNLRVKYSNHSDSAKFLDESDERKSLNNCRSLNRLDCKEKIIEGVVLDWLMQIKFKASDEISKTINIIDATDILTKRLTPLLFKHSCNKNFKLLLKDVIVNVLNELPGFLHYPPNNKRVYLNRIAEDLANRLMCIQLKYRRSNGCCPKERSMYHLAVSSKSSLKQAILNELSSLQNISLDQRNDVKEEIIDILIDCLESIRFKEDLEDKDELINNVLGTPVEMSETQTSDVTLENVRGTLTEDIIGVQNSNKIVKEEISCHSGLVAVYASEHDISGKHLFTSTPKQKGSTSKEEISYVENIKSVIKDWMKTLPKNFEKDKNFKEVMINDLIGDIVDQHKVQQLAHLGTKSETDKFMSYIIFRWLCRFEVYEELSKAKPQVDDLVKRLHKVAAPNLTKPQTVKSKAIGPRENDWPNDIQDEIFNWVSEQPKDIYTRTDKDYQQKMVHELTETVKRCILDNKLKELKSDLKKWLKIMLKSSEKGKIDNLAQSLNSRLLKLPQAATVASTSSHSSKGEKLSNASGSKIFKPAKFNQNSDTMKVISSPKDVSASGSGTSHSINERSVSQSLCSKTSCPKNVKNAAVNASTASDNDKTLMEYIGKYMDRKYDVDDSMARGAFGEILKTEFRKLAATTEEVNDGAAAPHDATSPDRLNKELQYIKDISDWLKNIPIDGSFNMPQNKERVVFVNDLATAIYEMEEQRMNNPVAVDYNMHLVSIIKQFTERLPILPDHTDNVMLMVDQLLNKIIANRPPPPCCMSANCTETSMNGTSIPEQNLTEFIDNYVRVNAAEIADDPVKLDAWSARVLKEAKKKISDSEDPTYYKDQMYDNLALLSIPEEESVRLFGLELDYAKQISDWLNNLPLASITTSEEKEHRIKMISVLAEKFVERERHKLTSSRDDQSDEEIEQYVSNWINEIPLDSNREVVKPVVIQQLLKRIERVNKSSQELVQTTSDQSTNTPRKSKVKPRTSKVGKTSGNSGVKPGQLIVEAIESWSNNLPIKSKDKDEEKSIKDNVARKLFQKVGDLSVDPQVMNDDLLYQELLANEVNQQLDSLPENPDMKKKKESLKNSLIEKVMEAKGVVKENAAGENYKQLLENTIDASIPIPFNTNQSHDPGFEIYRNRVAEMFILENFNHASDDVKVKYEKRIKKDIDKYCQDAQRRNALPLSKEQIYNELYGSLFKVPMPRGHSTAEEVEEVKTRCEVAEWFESLPLQKATTGEELLNRDQIQSMLAKRLREIEAKEKNPDEKMHKEITKWLSKLPLRNGGSSNIDKLAEDLQNKLKSTKEDRKCVTQTNNKDNKKLKSPSKKTSKTKGILGTSQVAGPSAAGHMWVSPPTSPVCCQVSTTPRKKAANIILEIVQDWCENLPFYEGTNESQQINKMIREDLLTRIIIKLCELNDDPNIFSDDLLYNCLLDEELEHLMAELPICCDFQSTKEIKKEELKAAINEVKPLMREERARHEYKKELNSTITNVVKEPLDTSADKVALFNELREEIVNDFIQCYYNRDDDEGKQIYKAKLRDAVLKYFQEVQDSPDEVDPLIRHNQLLCELGKIPIPGERAVQDEVEEIRMKEEVNEFFEEIPLPDTSETTETNKIKVSLAKRLNDLEKTGHNCTNDAKMKKEISRYLKKLDVEVNRDKIETFVEKLKSNEAARKALPIRKDDASASDFNQDDINTTPKSCDCNNNIQNQIQGTIARPISNEYFNTSQDPRDSRNPTGSKICCPQTSNNARSLGVTPVEYQGFGGGVAVSSSRRQSRSQTNGRTSSQVPPTSNVGPNTHAMNAANVCPNHNQALQNAANICPNYQAQNANDEAPNEPISTDREGTHRFQANKRRKQELDEEECNCLAGRRRRKMKGRPRCVLKHAFCEECEDFGPMMMPRPTYRCPPGYFYY